MEKLREYLNTRSTLEQEQFARRCGTSIGYLRKCVSQGEMGAAVAIAVDRGSDGLVPFESLCPNIDISHLRGRKPKTAKPGPRKQRAA